MQDSTTTHFCLLVLGTSLLVVLSAYYFVSRKCQNYVNILTPFILMPVPAYFILEGVNLYTLGYSGSKFAYIYNYATYAFGAIAIAVGFLAADGIKVSPVVRIPHLVFPGMSYVLLILACALYAPVLIEHPDLIASPRELYAITRVGYGLESYLSTFFVYVGFIFLLFERRSSIVLKVIYSITAVAVLYLHGSKGQVIALFFIWLYFSAFVQRRQFKAGRLVLLGGGVSILMMGLFYLTFPEQLRADLLESIAGYSSEYTRNALLVIDDSELAPQLGRLTLENNFYAFIPREIFPNKRKDFGSLWLANHYYPERFQDERGAPAFGLGLEYADFGIFAIIYRVTLQLLTGILARVLVNNLQVRPNPGDFALLLILLDVPLIPTGTGFPFPIYYIIAVLMKGFGETDRKMVFEAAAGFKVPA